ncbi:MAG TPA: hypothetical protein VLR26_13575 [Frankiaceae bacterium]|nr:hypothetical protein [Frankiaceae bacterium]
MILATRLEAAELPSSLHYAAGPLVALIAVLGLGLLSRWWMAPSRTAQQRRERNRTRRDFGLLVPVAVRSRRAEADEVAALLDASGVRATVVVEPPGPTLITAAGHVRRQPGGRHQVLVFGKDAPRAKALLGPDSD